MRNGQTALTRYRKRKKSMEKKVEKFYDLYIDRKMVEKEFDLLWEKQKSFDASLYSEEN